MGKPISTLRKLIRLLNIASENKMSLTIDFHEMELTLHENFPKKLNKFDIEYIQSKGFKIQTPVQLDEYKKKGLNL